MITLLDGGNTTTTGGTNQNFSALGKTVTNGRAYGDSAVSDMQAREELVLTSRAATYQDGRWSKQKCKATYVIPYAEDGEMFYSLVRIEMEVAPKHLASNSTLFAELGEKGAQLLKDSEMTTFWTTGAVPT